MADSSDILFMAPYKKEVDAIMDHVIGETETALEKNTPEGLLGNFVTDACVAHIRNVKPEVKVDFCFFNNGGLRTPLPKGEIKVGNVFELMPFENELVLVFVNGDVVQEVCDFMAEKGGVPVSGLNMEMKGAKAINILIDRKVLDASKKYCILTSDFLANGGDNLIMLLKAEKINTGIKVRDAIMEFIKSQTAQNKKLKSNIEGRITNAK